MAPAIQADTTLYERVSRRDVTAPDSGSRRGPRPLASLVRGRRAEVRYEALEQVS